MTEFTFQILAPERVIFSGNIVSLVAPGQEGYFGVLAHHAPMLAALTAGEMKVTDTSGNVVYYAVSGGVLEVSRDEVILLADSAERAEEIDLDRAAAAQKRAAERMAQGDDTDTDINRAQAALMRAITRLQVAAKRATHS